MLELRNLSVGYNTVPIIDNLSFSVDKGKITTVIAQNGTGKTTLLKTIAGSLSILSGSILFQGERIEGLSVQKRIKKGIVLVPEGRQLFPRMSVLENILLGGYTVRNSKNVKERIKEIFSIFPSFKGRLKQQASTLSGGEQQLLAIARGLVSKPQLLMIDEVSLGLSPGNIISVYESLGQLNGKGTTILLVEQNARFVERYSDKTFLLGNG